MKKEIRGAAWIRNELFIFVFSLRPLRFILSLVPVSLLFGCAFFAGNPDEYPKLSTVPWKDKNIIIVLGMRSEKSGEQVTLPEFALPRVREGERLYRQCKSAGKVCLILASGGDPANNGVCEAELIKRRLVKNQVPAKDILVEGTSNTTADNAKYSSEMLSKQLPDLTVLVTSDVHLPRAMKNFEEFGVYPLPAPAMSPK